jgi:hypothetical protein
LRYIEIRDDLEFARLSAAGAGAPHAHLAITSVWRDRTLSSRRSAEFTHRE